MLEDKDASRGEGEASVWAGLRELPLSTQEPKYRLNFAGSFLRVVALENPTAGLQVEKEQCWETEVPISSECSPRLALSLHPHRHQALCSFKRAQSPSPCVRGGSTSRETLHRGWLRRRRRGGPWHSPGESPCRCRRYSPPSGRSLSCSSPGLSQNQHHRTPSPAMVPGRHRKEKHLSGKASFPCQAPGGGLESLGPELV